ncbi:hypothetical protein HDU67_002149, partial [Dinochytrium kinnereticum]
MDDSTLLQLLNAPAATGPGAQKGTAIPTPSPMPHAGGGFGLASPPFDIEQMMAAAKAAAVVAENMQEMIRWQLMQQQMQLHIPSGPPAVTDMLLSPPMSLGAQHQRLEGADQLIQDSLPTDTSMTSMSDFLFSSFTGTDEEMADYFALPTGSSFFHSSSSSSLPTLTPSTSSSSLPLLHASSPAITLHSPLSPMPVKPGNRGGNAEPSVTPATHSADEKATHAGQGGSHPNTPASPAPITPPQPISSTEPSPSTLNVASPTSPPKRKRGRPPGERKAVNPGRKAIVAANAVAAAAAVRKAALELSSKGETDRLGIHPAEKNAYTPISILPADFPPPKYPPLDANNFQPPPQNIFDPRLMSQPPSAPPPPKQQRKTAHNAIERRYRNNINQRISDLRAVVPALNSAASRKGGAPTGGGDEDDSDDGDDQGDIVDGIPAATKLNKATILRKATEYIVYLRDEVAKAKEEVAS